MLPSRMNRILVGGHAQHQEGVIETLHQQGVLHLEDYHDPTGTTRIGTPLEAGDRASEALVAVRGLLKALGTEHAIPSSETAGEPRSTLQSAEAHTGPALQRAGQVRARLVALDAEEQALEAIRGLPVDLGLARSLTSVRVAVGTARADPTEAFRKSGVVHDIHAVPLGTSFAVAAVVAAKDGPIADRLLADAGFTATLATGAGTPAQRLAGLAAERAELRRELEAAEAEVAGLRASWGPRLARLEAELAAEVERTQAPLRFGVTDHTFHIEGWVPRAELGRVRQALAARFGDSLYFEDLGDVPAHGGHGHEATATSTMGPAGHDDAAAHHEEGEHHSDPASEPPVHLENPKPARPYQYLLGLLGRPRYKEVDPTKLMLVFFPLFFGLMVGDLAVGILIMLVGAFLIKNKVFGIGGPAIGKSIMAGGFMSALVGLFVFGEALGIHFVVDAHAASQGELSWENILGLHLPDHGFLFKTGGGHEALETALEGNLTTHAGEATGLAGILTPHTDTHLSLAGIVNLGYYSKVHDTMALLVWAMLIGLVHVILGLLIGVRNVYVQHGAKLAVQEKVAWLTLMAGGGAAVLAWGGILGYLGLGVAVASVVLLYMGAAHVIGVGFIALLEIPGLAGNILSYTRLAAIGASKAGMAIAFANIAFGVVGGGTTEAPNTASVVGWVVYLLSFSLILVLSIIAGTLQSLRLQFVEFFSKFFAGGGRAYLPFGRRAA
jgi:V/A-type H+-transporting ATPase subunit I